MGRTLARAPRGRARQNRNVITNKTRSGPASAPQAEQYPSTPRDATPRGFEVFDLGPELTQAVAAMGFTAPRPIQEGTIAPALAGRDILGLAQTGTGKTAAFALPIIERLRRKPRSGGRSRALILAPTRELAIQIHAEIGALARFTRVTATTVFGGVNASAQVKALRKTPDIIVACPGRLLDLMGSGDVRLDGIEVLVLDEADHMLDMGFLPDIKRVLAKLPPKRQNLLFSATMPKEIRSLTQGLLHEPHVVELAVSAPLDAIEHALYPVGQAHKFDLLCHLLDDDDFRSAIVFLRTKHRTKKLARDLERAGHHAIALQGNMSQNQRQRAMQGFRDGTYDVLVATDIAARGIDVAGVSHVVNFDVPDTPDAYTHRIGRTGRAQRTGKAFTFVTHHDFAAIKDIERQLDMQIPRIKIKHFEASAEELAEPPKGPGSAGGRGGGRGGSGGGRQGGGRSGGGGGGGRSQPAASKLSKGGRKRRRVAGGASGGSSGGKVSASRPAPAPRSVGNVGRRVRGR